jgi:4'-phosphopantetheinyl transferase
MAAGNDDRPSLARQLPALDDELAIWLCPLTLAPATLAGCEASLSAPERLRAARFGTAALRERYIAGRGTLRMLLGAVLGQTPPNVPLIRSPRGRPMLGSPDCRLDFNVTHTRDMALIVILSAAHPAARIGIDIEHADRHVGADRLAKRYMTSREQQESRDLDADARRRRFLRLWTAKEAMSKATGDGLRAPMGQIEVDLHNGPQLVTGPPPYVAGAWRLFDVPLTHGFIATAARWSGRGDR